MPFLPYYINGPVVNIPRGPVRGVSLIHVSGGRYNHVPGVIFAVGYQMAFQDLIDSILFGGKRMVAVV